MVNSNFSHFEVIIRAAHTIVFSGENIKAKKKKKKKDSERKKKGNECHVNEAHSPPHSLLSVPEFSKK